MIFTYNFREKMRSEACAIKCRRVETSNGEPSAFEKYGAKSLKAIKIASVDGPFNGLTNTSDLKPRFPT